MYLFDNRYTGEGMDEMEFTEAESNLNDLISEYQQYQVCFVITIITNQIRYLPSCCYLHKMFLHKIFWTFFSG